MKRLVTILTISLLLISSFAQNQWQLAKDKNGIKVYVKPMPGTHLKACKTITVINAPVEKVFQLVRDVNSAPQWVENVSYARELDAGKDYYYCYQIIKIGYGIKDRDIVTYETIHHYNDGKIKIIIQGAPDHYPRQKGKVRIEKVSGYWILEPIGRKKNPSDV